MCSFLAIIVVVRGYITLFSETKMASAFDHTPKIIHGIVIVSAKRDLMHVFFKISLIIFNILEV